MSDPAPHDRPWRALALRVALPLVLGASAYLFRPNEVRAIAWLEPIGLAGLVRALRRATAPLGRHLPHAVTDVLPDIAWAFAVGSLLAILWRDKPAAARRAWLAAGALLAVGYELAQGAKLVRGTFDWIDLAAQAIAYVAALAVDVALARRSRSR